MRGEAGNNLETVARQPPDGPARGAGAACALSRLNRVRKRRLAAQHAIRLQPLRDASTVR